MSIFSLFASSEILDVLGLNPAGLIGQFIVVLAVFLILNKYAFPPIMKMLEERRSKIEISEKNAVEIQKRLEETDQKIQEMISDANKKSQDLIDEAKSSAEIVGEKKKSEALKEAQLLIEKARDASIAERDKMISDLKKDFSKMVVTATSKVTGKILDEGDKEKINKESISQISL